MGNSKWWWWWLVLLGTLPLVGALRIAIEAGSMQLKSPVASRRQEVRWILAERRHIRSPTTAKRWTLSTPVPVPAGAALAVTENAFRMDPAVRYYTPTDTFPDTVVIGDVIGDSRPDIVLTAVGPYFVNENYKVHIYEQKSDGTLAPPVSLSYLVRTDRTGLDLIDLNADGRSEIVIGHDHGLTIVRRDNGQFTATKIDSALRLDYLGVLDADRDGHPDVFAQSPQEGAEIYFGDGRGGFREVQRFATSAFGYNTVEVEDYTADGRKDLILTNGQGWSKVWIYPNDPVAGLQAANTIDLGAILRYPPWGVTVADFNNDGRPDMAVSDSGNEASEGTGIRILYRNANGALDNPILLSTWKAPEPVAAADLDGNGLVDVVTLYGSWNTMAYFLQQPTGFMQATTLPTSLPTYTFNSHYKDNSLVLGDVNSDRCIDIVVADPSYGLLVFPGRNCQIKQWKTGGPYPSVQL